MAVAVRNKNEEMGDLMPDTETELLIGRNPVREALRSGQPVDTVYLCRSSGMGDIIALAREAGAVVKQISEQKLSQMAAGGVHQGVAASVACAAYVTLEELLDVSRRKGTAPFLILCDGIEDPHNLGAIIRTAETAGADGVVIPKRLPVARVPNLGAAIDRLKEAGVWIYGTDMQGTLYTETRFDGAVALVIGSEGAGMSRLVREKCDFLVKLPMMGKITSLNASVAAGIFMYEVVRQRG